MKPEDKSNSEINQEQTPQNTISPNLNIAENPKPTSRDKIIGIVLSGIGVLGILGAFLRLIDFYNKVPGSGDVPPYIYLIVPLLFLYSGYYYISGKNAERIQRKVNKNLATKKKLDKAQLLLAIIIISIIGYLVWYTSNTSDENVVYTPEATSEADKAALDEKRTEIANNIAAAQREYQKNNQGGIKMGLEDLGIDLTDPATGEQYKFAGLLKDDSSYFHLNSIHISDSAKCAEDGSGYMVETKDKNTFAFAIERETLPPICFDFQGTLYL